MVGFFSLQFQSFSLYLWCIVTCCLVTRSCLTLCDPTDWSTPGFPVLHHLQSLLKLTSIESGMPSNHLILCCPLLLLPSIFASIRGFSNESALRIRWPKYWSFSFSISPFNEYSGMISFRMDWFDLLAVQLYHPLDCLIAKYIVQWQIHCTLKAVHFIFLLKMWMCGRQILELPLSED